MDKTLSDLLASLTTIQHEKISEVELRDDCLFFKYLGGKFYVYKQIISSHPEKGYLKVYHESPVEKDKKIEVDNFYVESDKYGHLNITNYLPNNLTGFLQQMTNSPLLGILTDSLPQSFVQHFDAKMLKEDFKITPTK